jgi:hypothetical protein
MSTRNLFARPRPGKPPPAPAPDAVQRLHSDAVAAGEAELARACSAALSGDPAARAALSLALSDDDDAEPCPVTLPTGGGW